MLSCKHRAWPRPQVDICRLVGQVHIKTLRCCAFARLFRWLVCHVPASVPFKVQHVAHIVFVFESCEFARGNLKGLVPSQRDIDSNQLRRIGDRSRLST